MLHILFEQIDDDNALQELVENAGSVALQKLGKEASDVSIVLTNDTEITRLNTDYRGFEKPTDVLSFPADMQEPDAGRPYLGDVIISVEYAQRQADSSGHSLHQEVELLVVHGLLHLSGYDHYEGDEKEEMWSLQASILDTLNNPLRPE